MELRIQNLDYFLENLSSNSPFKVLAELEEIVEENKEPETTILVGYTSNADCIFDLVNVVEEKDKKVAIYNFATTAS